MTYKFNQDEKVKVKKTGEEGVVYSRLPGSPTPVGAVFSNSPVVIWYDDEELELINTNDAGEEHTGGSSSYYTVKVETTTTPYALPYTAECNDIIEALGMTFAEGNAFKAIWRTAAARQGKKKKGNNAVYDAEKVCFFGERMLARAKGEDV